MTRDAQPMQFGSFMEFHTRPGGSQADAFAESFEHVRQAEEQGLDGVWLSETHFTPERALTSSPLMLASAIAGTEARLFDARQAAGDADAVAVHLLLFRLPEGLASEDQAGLPMKLLARYGLGASEVAAGKGEALLRDWAAELIAALPPASSHDGPFRRLRAGFDRARLARLAKGRGFDPPGPFATLLRAWRLARRT